MIIALISGSMHEVQGMLSPVELQLSTSRQRPITALIAAARRLGNQVGESWREQERWSKHQI
jgi:hypothetical protein